MTSHVVIKEGPTHLAVPELHSSGGPGTKGLDVFYNSQMAFNRDVSIMFLRALGPGLKVADCMAATGSRSARMANEVPDIEVVANDIDPRSSDFIQKNIELNGLNNLRANNQDLACLLSEERFDYVDIDPFGSPIPYLHSAIKGVSRNGVLALTATDTAPLAGARRDKCERRYLARPMKWPGHHESGLRILLGTVARDLARFDKGMEPLLSFYCDHYFRIYVRVTKGAERADRTLSQLGYMAYDSKSLQRSVSSKPEGHPYGPMWLGPLHDRGLLSKMDADESLQETARCAKMLNLWREELDTPICYEVAELSSHLKVSPPRMERFLRSLSKRGPASRSHISPTIFRTDLPLEEVFISYLEATEIDNL